MKKHFRSLWESSNKLVKSKKLNIIRKKKWFLTLIYLQKFCREIWTYFTVAFLIHFSLSLWNKSNHPKRTPPHPKKKAISVICHIKFRPDRSSYYRRLFVIIGKHKFSNCSTFQKSPCQFISFVKIKI